MCGRSLPLRAFRYPLHEAVRFYLWWDSQSPRYKQTPSKGQLAPVTTPCQEAKGETPLVSLRWGSPVLARACPPAVSQQRAPARCGPSRLSPGPQGWAWRRRQMWPLGWETPSLELGSLASCCVRLAQGNPAEDPGRGVPQPHPTPIRGGALPLSGAPSLPAHFSPRSS